MENKKEILEKLLKRNEVLKKIVFVGFKTEKELLKYREKIKNERDEYYDNLEQIEKLEWDLKTPEEKERYLKEEEISKLKRERKL